MKTELHADTKSPRLEGAAPYNPPVNLTEFTLPNPLISRVCTLLHVNKNIFSAAPSAGYQSTDRLPHTVPPRASLQASNSARRKALKYSRFTSVTGTRIDGAVRTLRVSPKFAQRTPGFVKPTLERIVVVISSFLSRFVTKVTFSFPTPSDPVLRVHSGSFMIPSIDLKILCNLPPSISQDPCV